MNEQITELLLPCPFCNGDAAFGKITYSEQYVKDAGLEQREFVTVNCIQCNASTEKITGCRTKEEAADLWNRRFKSEDD